MHRINASFKDILRIGTADSSFSVICSDPVHDYVHRFLQVFIHSPLSFTSAHFLSSRVHGPASLTSSHLLSFTDPRTCVFHRSSLLQSFVPLSFPGPNFLSFTGPRTCRVHRFPLPALFISPQEEHGMVI
jgi:hypothetical protein